MAITRELQRQITKEIAAAIAGRMLHDIDNGKIPETWDGHELRALARRILNENAENSIIAREPRSRRARDFRNTCIINNL